MIRPTRQHALTRRGEGFSFRRQMSLHKRFGMVVLSSWSAARLVVCMVLISALSPAQAQSLPDLYQQALSADPAYTGVSAQRRVADERVIQARAGFLPTVVYTASESRAHYVSQLEHRPFASRDNRDQIVLRIFDAGGS